MSDHVVFIVYAVASACWLLLLTVIVLLLRRGLRAFFSDLSDNRDIVTLLVRMGLLSLLLIGAGNILGHSYTTGEKANWLTVTWNVADQFRDMAFGLTLILVIFALTFLLLYIVGKRLGVVCK